MNSKLIVVGVVLILVVGAGAFFFINANKPKAEVTSPAQEEAQRQNNISPTESAVPTEAITTETKTKEVGITITNQGYSPKTITIDKGTRVVWTNNSGIMANISSDPHPTHTSYPRLNLGNFGDGESFELTFNEAGTYGYHNHLNATQKGTIIVK